MVDGKLSGLSTKFFYRIGIAIGIGIVFSIPSIAGRRAFPGARTSALDGKIAIHPQGGRGRPPSRGGIFIVKKQC